MTALRVCRSRETARMETRLRDAKTLQRGAQSDPDKVPHLHRDQPAERPKSR